MTPTIIINKKKKISLKDYINKHSKYSDWNIVAKGKGKGINVISPIGDKEIKINFPGGKITIDDMTMLVLHQKQHVVFNCHTVEVKSQGRICLYINETSSLDNNSKKTASPKIETPDTDFYSNIIKNKVDGINKWQDTVAKISLRNLVNYGSIYLNGIISHIGDENMTISNTNAKYCETCEKNKDGSKECLYCHNGISTITSLGMTKFDLLPLNNRNTVKISNFLIGSSKLKKKENSNVYSLFHIYKHDFFSKQTALDFIKQRNAHLMCFVKDPILDKNSPIWHITRPSIDEDIADSRNKINKLCEKNGVKLK